MGESSQPSDVELLRHTFPSWVFGVVWQAANSGPDNRRLWAIRGGVILSAPDADSLARQVIAEQIAEGER